MNKTISKTILIASVLGLGACAQPETSEGAEVPRAKLLEIDTPPEVLPEFATAPTSATTPTTISSVAPRESVTRTRSTRRTNWPSTAATKPPTAR